MEIPKGQQAQVRQPPPGWESIEAYTNGLEIVILGMPPENCPDHNCKKWVVI
jgi:hypothetical protein